MWNATVNLDSETRREDLDLSALGGLEFIANDPATVRRRYAHIRVALPDLRGTESDAYERALNRQLHSSGSGVAVGTMLATTLVYVGYLALTGNSLAGSWRHLGVGSALVLSGAALGKVLGLFYWNLVLRRTALRLRGLLLDSKAILSRTRTVPEELPPFASISAGEVH